MTNQSRGAAQRVSLWRAPDLVFHTLHKEQPMITNRTLGRIRVAVLSTLLGTALGGSTASAEDSYEECVEKVFRTDSCQSTGWWSDGTCEAKTLDQCTL